MSEKDKIRIAKEAELVIQNPNIHEALNDLLNLLLEVIDNV